jgi:hypothetical protein
VLTWAETALSAHLRLPPRGPDRETSRVGVWHVCPTRQGPHPHHHTHGLGLYTTGSAAQSFTHARRVVAHRRVARSPYSVSRARDPTVVWDPLPPLFLFSTVRLGTGCCAAWLASCGSMIFDLPINWSREHLFTPPVVRRHRITTLGLRMNSKRARWWTTSEVHRWGPSLHHYR